MSSTMLKLYGVPLSQPFRSVAWCMLLLPRAPRFEIILTVPLLSDHPRGSRHPSYTSKTKAKYNRIPLLEDGKFCLVESPAILSYLCERFNHKYGIDDTLYGPSGSTRKATIDSYMHWHHLGTRRLSSLVAPFVLPGSKYQLREKDQVQAQKVLQELEQGWLNPSEPFIAGENVSIADLLCYEDIVQTTLTELVSLEDFPSIRAWTQRMEGLPFHNQVHSALTTLGSLTAPNETPMEQRLKAATKAGLVALQSAQEQRQQQHESGEVASRL
mmetsp:Transcript_10143/g.19525  ORF Transcript_10143/g.19525 Transcript_10143/m.19525 type:complete len:271 (+) Transcript_10143:50-862(+)